MFPIFEQRTGRGIGCTLDDFLQRIDEICRKHTEDERAKFFAFIFYDFHDRAIRRVLKDLGGFAKLDRLSGNALTIFYLHAGGRESIERFNQEMASHLGLAGQLKPPCVLFCKLADGGLTDISMAPLDSPDVIHGLDELCTIVRRQIEENGRIPVDTGKSLRWIRSGAKFVTVEGLKAAIRIGLGHLL